MNIIEARILATGKQHQVIAEEARINKTTLSLLIKNGIKNAKFGTLEKLAKVLNCTPEKLDIEYCDREEVIELEEKINNIKVE